eukprot:PITA_11500
MSLEEPPWIDTHHRSSFLPRLAVMSMCLEKFSSQLPIDISVYPDVMSTTPHIGFADGACRSTRNLSSTSCAIYDPNEELFYLQGIYLGRTTNNIAEYSAVIELLLEAIALDIRELVVNLDSQLVILQLNGKYSVRNPQTLRMYLCIRLLERNFVYITYHHIPRRMNTLTDALANYVLDRHLRHM